MTSPAFLAARTFERELTPRQHEILAMIAAGRTNPEIADALGMTLDGAKWHVSEVLSKLGVATREEAAEYWRWRNRPGARLQRVLRGLVPSMTARWLGAGAAVAAIAVVAMLLAFGQHDGAPPGAATPFLMEGEVWVGRDQPDQPNGLPLPGGTSHTTVRWAVQDEAHWRWDVESVEPVFRAGKTTASANGTDFTTHTLPRNTYMTSPLVQLSATTLIPPSFGVFMGPTMVASVDEFLASLRDVGEGRTAEIVGKDRILGRDVVVIESDPAFTIDNSGVQKSGGSLRIYLDPERMFVMAGTYDGPPDGSGYEFRVTKLEYGSKPHDRDVEFALPPGARLQVDTQSSSSYISPNSNSAGYPMPGWLPEGFTWVAGEQGGGGGSDGAVTLETTYAPSQSSGIRPYVRSQQASGFDQAPAASRRGAEPLKVGANDGWFRNAGTTISITWVQDGLLTILTARGVSKEDLLRVATSYQP